MNCRNPFSRRQGRGSVLLTALLLATALALGLAGYLGYLSWRVFRDSLVFPFALSAVGLGIIWLGVLWQRREAEWSTRLRAHLPADLRELIEARAVR